ncbi:MAG: 50S ribosomal protein L11 methyltransferase [Alphaproteobacteria bacterium]|jgi:ribosomal protein L11 methyltransferase|nr:50S ribosomal protein L11 methyltransferase [Alphaproteobacteria bacterium]
MKYLKLYLQTNNINPFEETVEEYVSSIFIQGVVGFEIDSSDILSLCFSRWEVLINPLSEDTTSLEDFINSVCKNLDIKVISTQIIEDNTDYLNQQEHRYSLSLGNFVVFNNLEDYSKFYSPKSIAIFINQSTAFGTGKHETTSMCLETIENFYNKGYNFKNMLDLGCGSAILAIAMSKLFSGKILATDIDPLALTTAKEFVVKNQANNITMLLSEGFASINKQKFDLITANILLNPLLSMQEDFYNYLEKDGYLVLSGFLDSQVAELRNTFEKQFKLVEIKEKDSWRAIVYTK